MNVYKALEQLHEIYDYLDDSPEFRKYLIDIMEWLKGVNT